MPVNMTISNYSFIVSIIADVRSGKRMKSGMAPNNLSRFMRSSHTLKLVRNIFCGLFRPLRSTDMSRQTPIPCKTMLHTFNSSRITFIMIMLFAIESTVINFCRGCMQLIQRVNYSVNQRVNLRVNVS